MASGEGGPATWHSRPPRGCDAALRPHGRAAGGPRGAQEAQSGTATWQGGHATTCAPVWGATCRLIIEGDGNAIDRRMHPLIYMRRFPLFLLCGTMFPHDF